MPVFNYHLTAKEDLPDDIINIMRPNRHSNRFVIGKDGDRDEVIGKYRSDLWDRIQSGEITIDELAELDGANLLCCCHPLPCHGDTLLAAASWAAKQKGPRRG